MTKPRRIVVIGASLAGLNGVQAAREAGFDGRRTLIGDEPHPPYDRPPLSKDWLRGGAAPAAPILCSAEQLRRDLDVDAVIVSIGAEPATDWLQGSGLSLAGGVACDARLSAGFDGVWAAGDVARRPHAFSGRLARIEQGTNAVEPGRRAMLNALDPAEASPYRAVPYFWSDWGEDALQFAGVAEGVRQIVSGAFDADGFVALYLDGAAFRGVLTLNRRADVMKYRASLDRGATGAHAMALAASRAKKQGEAHG